MAKFALLGYLKHCYELS